MRETTETRREVLQEFLSEQMARPEERIRLLRFCRRLTGENEAAEDLTQEAMAEAWRQMDSLQNPQVWRSWLHGIARNMYLRWQRARAREQAQTIAPVGGQSFDSLLEARPAPGSDLSVSLERHELALLLGRALAYLPPPTRQMLTLYYLDDLPPQEIASRLGVSENAASVRLYRGKRHLHRILTEDLRAEAAAFGLVSAQDPEISSGSIGGRGQETHLWCPFCGKARLHQITTETTRRFGCPHCSFVLGPRRIPYPSDCIFGHHLFRPETVLEGVSGFKPMVNRLAQHWSSYLEQGRRRGMVSCIGCGRSLPLSTRRPAHLQPRPYAGFHIHCSHCQKIHVLLPSAFAFTSAPAQDFWKRHPRIRLLPSRPLPGSNAFSIGFESVTDSARLELTYSADDYRLIC